MNKTLQCCYLQDFPGDVFLAALTLDAKHGMVVHLTVGDSIPEKRTQDKWADERGSAFTSHRKQLRDSQSFLYQEKILLPLFSTGYEGLNGSSDLLADVLGVEHLVAHFALEAAQVPVLVQCYKGLLILELLSTATAI